MAARAGSTGYSNIAAVPPGTPTTTLYAPNNGATTVSVLPV